MLRKKEVLTAVGTLGCAIGIGFVMQNSADADRHYGERQAAPEMAEGPAMGATSLDNTLLDVQAITLTSAEFETETALPTAIDEVETAAAPKSVLEEPELPQAITVPGCEVNASARPVAAAMVELSMSAPCLTNERVTVHHNGMVFSETTTADGGMNIRVPALTEDAVFVIAFASGEGAVAQTMVDELADFNRVALQWKGDTGLQIHAREFGADYGSAGHLWAEAPGDLAAAVSGVSGVLTRHGDTAVEDPLTVEVYTFPKQTSGQFGEIILSVEAEVTDANCGLEIEAQSLEKQPGGQMTTKNVVLSMPACDAKGTFIVLNNLFQDLKVAAR